MMILVTTQHRGVFCGQVADDQDLTTTTMHIEMAKMAIYWGTTKGVAELAATGPTAKSRIGVAADVTIHDITAVWQVTPAAAEAWGAR